MSEVWFAQIREDAAVEESVLDGRRRVVCIGSGGEVALSMLRDGVEEVFAVDLNPAQCAVIELKRAALCLDKPAYLAFVGESPADDRARTCRALPLPAGAREFWDARPDLLAAGANHCGVTERFYRYVGGSLRASVVPDEAWRSLLACRSIDEQRALHARFFSGAAWRTAVRVLLSRSTHLLFYPAFMFANATEHDFGDFFARQFDREVLEKPIAGNYFLSQLLFGRWLEESAPPYVMRWEETRRNAGKLRVVAAGIAQFLEHQRGVDAFSLSNVFDWLPPDGRAQLCAAIRRAASPGAVVVYRNMLSAPKLPDDFPLQVDAARSAALHELERSMSYQRVTCGVLP